MERDVERVMIFTLYVFIVHTRVIWGESRNIPLLLVGGFLFIVKRVPWAMAEKRSIGWDYGGDLTRDLLRCPSITLNSYAYRFCVFVTRELESSVLWLIHCVCSAVFMTAHDFHVH